MRSIDQIAADLNDLDFDDDARADTAKAVSLLSELARAMFAPDRHSELGQRQALVAAISRLSQHLPHGRYSYIENIIAMLLDCISDELPFPSEQPDEIERRAAERVSKYTEADFLLAIHELSIWLPRPGPE